MIKIRSYVCTVCGARFYGYTAAEFHSRTTLASINITTEVFE